MAWALEPLLYIIAGIGTGLLSGILGIGGGIIVVPTLFWIFSMNPGIPTPMTMHLAAGSSLAVMIFTSMAAVRAHYQIEAIQWRTCFKVGIWLGVGTIAGAILATQLPTGILKKLFAAFLLWIVYTMRQQALPRQTAFPAAWLNATISTLIGVNSGLLGVGGGVLIVPYLTYCGIAIRRVPSISSVCTLMVACMGTLVFMWVTPHRVASVDYVTGYIYWPAVSWIAVASMLCAPIGARWSYSLPPTVIRRLFLGVLLVTAAGLVL